jgi:hypothetical protein
LSGDVRNIVKTYQIVDMPKPGKGKGICRVVPIFDVDMNVQRFEIPNGCNIEKVIIFYGDLLKAKREYARLKK